MRPTFSSCSVSPFFATPNSSVNQNAMHSDFIERNPRPGRRAFAARARECFLHFPKLTPGPADKTRSRSARMSKSNVIFGVNMICAFAKPANAFLQHAAQNHARLTRLAPLRRMSTCKNNACKMYRAEFTVQTAGI